MTKILLAVLLIVGCTPAASPTPAPRTIMGEVRLNNNNPVLRDADDCRGTKGFDDFSAALQATVKNDAGVIVGTARLTALPQSEPGFKGARLCDYTFSVTVPDAPFYSVEVGRRGALTYSRADLEAAGWTVSMEIGDPE